MRLPALPAFLALPLLLLGHASPAHACGGLVQPATGTVGMDAQRVFYSVRTARTEMVVQVGVPAAANGYGVLLPVPVQPVLDATAVPSAELDALETATRPSIMDSTKTDSSPSCGCGAAGGNDLGDRGVLVGGSVEVGPVTVVSLSADTGAAVSTWLQENGFVLPAASQALVDWYAGPGKWFVAMKRNGQTGSVPTSIGVHLGLDGDHREFAMRMARMGSKEDMAFTVWVAHGVAVAPASPWEGITLDALPKAVVRSDGYRAAVAKAAKDGFGRVWVMEGVFAKSVVGTGVLANLVDANARVTRMSTVLTPGDMTEDVAFTAPAPTEVPTTVVLSSSDKQDGPGGGFGGFMLLVLVGVLGWQVRPRRAVAALG